MFPGVSGGGDIEVEGTCSVAAVDETLAIEEANSGPGLEAIVLRRECERRMAETRASLIVRSGRVTACHVTGTFGPSITDCGNISGYGRILYD